MAKKVFDDKRGLFIFSPPDGGFGGHIKTGRGGAKWESRPPKTCQKLNFHEELEVSSFVCRGSARQKLPGAIFRPDGNKITCFDESESFSVHIVSFILHSVFDKAGSAKVLERYALQLIQK